MYIRTSLIKVFCAKVGECLDTIFIDAVDSDHAVLDLHFVGDVTQPVVIFAEAFVTWVMVVT